MGRASPDDWRRQGQERFLAGKRLRRQAYQPSRLGWDHDHCAFCGAKFSLQAPDLAEGHATEDSYHWVCDGCFEDFREEMGWPA